MLLFDVITPAQASALRMQALALPFEEGGQTVGKASADAYAPLAAAGLLVGDGLWAVPAAVLAVAGVVPPLCLKVN